MTELVDEQPRSQTDPAAVNVDELPADLKSVGLLDDQVQDLSYGIPPGQDDSPGAINVEESAAGSPGSVSDGRDTSPNGISTESCGCSRQPLPDDMSGFKMFEDRMNDQLRGLSPRRQQYDVVRVLLVRWSETDIEGCESNFEKLYDMFSERYGYQAETCVLDNVLRSTDKKSDGKMNGRIGRQFVKDLADITGAVDNDEGVNKLFILFYLGHGAERKIDETNEFVWQPKAQSRTFLHWTGYYEQLRHTECDILFLFDCCFAAALVPQDKTWNRRCELLGAASATDLAFANPKASFTVALEKELGKRAPVASSSMGQVTTQGPISTTVFGLYNYLGKSSVARSYNLKAPSWYRHNDKYTSSILLQSKRLSTSTPNSSANDSGYVSSADELDNLNDTRVLISLRLTDPAELTLLPEVEWMNWFENRPSNIAGIDFRIVQRIRCHCVFESDSTLALFSMPLWLWRLMQSDNTQPPSLAGVNVQRNSDDRTHSMETLLVGQETKASTFVGNPNRAMEEIGIIRSENLLTLDAAPWQASFDNKKHGFSDLEGMKKWKADLETSVKRREEVCDNLAASVKSQEVGIQAEQSQLKARETQLQEQSQALQRERVAVESSASRASAAAHRFLQKLRDKERPLASREKAVEYKERLLAKSMLVRQSERVSDMPGLVTTQRGIIGTILDGGNLARSSHGRISPISKRIDRAGRSTIDSAISQRLHNVTVPSF
jgi:hypothetical protein